MPAQTDRPPGGLRELKKARTRASIQRHALRLFREHGYADTTVEQIAQAAEVSPSTFFRYFPTKEDVAFHDEFDVVLTTALRAQPAGLSPILAMREAVGAVLGSVPAEDLEIERDRTQLLLTVPELHGRLLLEMQRSILMLAELVAQREGLDAEDYRVRNVTGAIVGVMMASMLSVMEDPKADYVTLVQQGLTHLEEGLPLGRAE